jgi:hypothetical protein
MARISVKRGSEGPEHDPYYYTEITFYFTDQNKTPVIIHQGLGDWIKYDGRIYIWDAYCVAAKFEELTGLSVNLAESIPNMLFERSMRKYSKEERWRIMECIEADEAMLRNAY